MSLKIVRLEIYQNLGDKQRVVGNYTDAVLA